MNAVQLSFVSERAAELWFLSAKRFVDDNKHSRPSQLSKLPGVPAHVVKGQWMPPVVRPKTGQLFFWKDHSVMYGQPSIEMFAEEIRRALRQTEPTVVIGGPTIYLIGFDGRDRLWFRYRDQQTVHAIGATEHVTLKPKTSIEAGLALPTERSGHFHVTGNGHTLFERLSVLDKQGRFYFGDNFGVHIIHPDSPEHFDYHPIYKIYYEKNLAPSSPNFSPIIQINMAITGKIFVWTAPGSYNPSLGYWTYDGNKWENVDIVPRVQDIFPRVYNGVRQIWIISGNELNVLEESLNSTEPPKTVPAQDLLPPGYFPFSRTVQSTFLARSEDNSSAVLWLSNGSLFIDSASTQRKPIELPANVNELFRELRGSNVNESSRNWIREGVIYFSNKKMIVAASIDGKTIEPYHCTETVSNFSLGVLHVGTKTTKLSRRKVPLVYMRDGSVLDTGVKYVDRSGIPSMRVTGEICPSLPSPSGGVYLKNEYWDGLNFPKPSPLRDLSFEMFIYGKDEAFIFGGPKKGYTLHYKGESRRAPDLCTLADQHYETLVQVLPYPPIPSSVDSFNMVHDGQGNLWVLEREKAGVRTSNKLLLVDTTVHKPADKTWVSMYTIAPLGDGTAVLLSNYYKSMLLSVQSDSLVVNDTPVAISVERVPGGASFFLTNTYYDSGEVYICTDNKTVACKSREVFEGQLCLIDRHGGKWFYRGGLNYVYGSRTYSLHVALRRVGAMQDYVLDHAVWVHTQASTFARIHFDGTQLRVIEEVKVGIDPWGMITSTGARNVLWAKETMGTAGMRCLVLDEKHMQ